MDQEMGKPPSDKTTFDIIEEGNENEVEEDTKGKAIKFGWVEGVFMRCLLNIWGVMLFLRLTWVIGQAGMVQGILLMTIANVVTTVTTLSMSAVCTNGQIKGGGVDYMISRSRPGMRKECYSTIIPT